MSDRPYGGHPDFGPRVVANDMHPSIAGWEALAKDALLAWEECRAALTKPTPPLLHMSAFEKAAAIERDQQWSDETPGGEPWSDQRKGAALFMAGYDRRGLLNELGWRKP